MVQKLDDATKRRPIVRPTTIENCTSAYFAGLRKTGMPEE
jgi:hypothetical protein